MCRRWWPILAALWLLESVRFFAAGTVTTTAQIVYPGLTKYTMTWMADASGVVSGHIAAIKPGYLVAAKVVPSTVTAPTALYDVTVVDVDVIDILNGLAANQSATVGAYFAFQPPLFFDGSQSLDLQITNAGNAGKGVVYLWVQTR